MAQGHEVRAFHRATSNLKLLENLDVEHFIGDITQPATIQPAMEGVDVVFHTAALLSSTDPGGRFYTVTVEGTRAVLEAARRAGVRRFIHTSSVAALGLPDAELPQPLAIDENHSWNGRPDQWPYGYAKHLAELEVQKAVAQGLDAVILNPSVVYGAGDVYRQTSSLVVHVARGKLPALVEGGLNAVHIEDVIDGHLAAMTCGLRGERYILGGYNLTISDLVRMIADVTGNPDGIPALVLPGKLVRALARPARLFQPFIDLPVSWRSFYQAGYHFYYNTAKARAQLALPETRPLADALREAYEWFIETGAIPQKNRG